MPTDEEWLLSKCQLESLAEELERIMLDGDEVIGPRLAALYARCLRHALELIEAEGHAR